MQEVEERRTAACAPAGGTVARGEVRRARLQANVAAAGAAMAARGRRHGTGDGVG